MVLPDALAWIRPSSRTRNTTVHPTLVPWLKRDGEVVLARTEHFLAPKIYGAILKTHFIS